MKVLRVSTCYYIFSMFGNKTAHRFSMISFCTITILFFSFIIDSVEMNQMNVPIRSELMKIKIVLIQEIHYIELSALSRFISSSYEITLNRSTRTINHINPFKELYDSVVVQNEFGLVLLKFPDPFSQVNKSDPMR